MYIHMCDDNGAICMMIRHLYASICIYMMILQILSQCILKYMEILYCLVYVYAWQYSFLRNVLPRY